MEAYIGTILAVGFNYAPVGWALCNGQLLQVQANQALFSLIGTKYGGNGTTTFGLPNLQSRIPIGYGQGAGLSPYIMGQVAGAEKTTLLVSQMPIHNHAAAFTGAAGTVNGGTATLPAITASGVLSTTTTVGTTNTPGTNIGPAQIAPIPFSLAQGGNKTINAYGTQDGSAKMTVDVTAGYTGGNTITIPGGSITPAGTVTVGNSGGSLPVSIMPPVLCVNYIICLAGLWPTRN